jgi:hypothetical protein
MKVKRHTSIDVNDLMRWMEEELFDWQSQCKFISMVKDKGTYEVFYSVHEPEDDLL